MASNPPAACCATGFKHEGTPVGEVKNIDGVNTYITYPKDNKTPEKAIVFLTDIFGIFPNSQLLADEFAKAGYLTVIPDLFQGDPINVADMESGKADLPSWLPKHQPANVDPVVEASVRYVRETLGAKSVGAIGYCFGAKYVTRLLMTNKVDVGFAAHPSFITHEELGAIQGPLSIAAAEIDSIFTTQLRHESENTLIKAGHPWQINLFSGVAHGFAIRGDMNVRIQRWAKEQAFVQAVSWFNQYL
ncbi:Dienelactone hydrolase family protein [Aspergillus parasiticus SU-1]|uniref:Dienelactone hydrolase family protein n=2 Tax=Aspergillus subgen. Circumdati TaxID=2720871 RepID=A0A0F0I610_ASPPU|nr:dienelactone hydrolase [Aspergillus transmontanensis]KJK62067.1 Dienelactone hydrolase family protein [Aspergillus parasiticus SU-1]